jgi:hypothetical protein
MAESFLKGRLLLGFVLLAAGVVFFLIGFNIEKKMWASRNWPSVQGKVVESKMSVSSSGRRTRIVFKLRLFHFEHKSHTQYQSN